MVHFLGVARHEIQKTIVSDESQHPIAVQIDYADRLEIERSLNLTSEEPKTADPSRLEKLLDVAVLDERIPHGMLERLKTFAVPFAACLAGSDRRRTYRSDKLRSRSPHRAGRTGVLQSSLFAKTWFRPLAWLKPELGRIAVSPQSSVVATAKRNVETIAQLEQQLAEPPRAAEEEK